MKEKDASVKKDTLSVQLRGLDLKCNTQNFTEETQSYTEGFMCACTSKEICQPDEAAV